MSVGKNIRTIRKLKKMTQKGLGLLCGMSDAQIRIYESERSIPKEDNLNKLAAALKVDPSVLRMEIPENATLEEIESVSYHREMIPTLMKIMSGEVDSNFERDVLEGKIPNDPVWIKNAKTLILSSVFSDYIDDLASFKNDKEEPEDHLPDPLAALKHPDLTKQDYEIVVDDSNKQVVFFNTFISDLEMLNDKGKTKALDYIKLLAMDPENRADPGIEESEKSK